MSPRTSTWTEILGSSADAEGTAFGGECFTYRLGNKSRITVKMVEAMVAKVKRMSSMATWLQELSCAGICVFPSFADHLQVSGAIPGTDDKRLWGNLFGMQIIRRDIKCLEGEVSSFTNSRASSAGLCQI